MKNLECRSSPDDGEEYWLSVADSRDVTGLGLFQTDVCFVFFLLENADLLKLKLFMGTYQY